MLNSHATAIVASMIGSMGQNEEGLRYWYDVAADVDDRKRDRLQSDTSCIPANLLWKTWCEKATQPVMHIIFPLRFADFSRV